MAANPEDLFPPTTQPPVGQPQTSQPVATATGIPTPAPPQSTGGAATQNLFSSSLPDTPPTLPGNTEVASQPAQATTRDVNPLDTVRGQLQELFDQGSPIMVQAREAAQRSAAGRGLQNSSIATQAGEQAVISSALPIAQQDANAYLNQGLANQQAQNQFGLMERQGQIASGAATQAYQQQYELARQQGLIASDMSVQEFQQQLEAARQKFGFDTSLSAQEAMQRLTELAAQGDQQARLALLNFGYETSLTNLRGEIALTQSNNDFANRLIELARQGDIQAQLNAQQFGFNTQLSAQENLQRLQQIAAQGDANAALQLQQFQFQSMLNDQQAGIQLTLDDARFQQNQNLVMLEYAQRGILSDQEAQAQMERLNQQHANTLEQIAAQVEAQTAADTANAGRALQNNYLLSVADRQRSASQEIAQIYQTEGLTATQQNAAVQNAFNRMMADIELLGRYYSSSPMWDDNWGVSAATDNTGSTTGTIGGGTTGAGTPSAPNVDVNNPADSYNQTFYANDPSPTNLFSDYITRSLQSEDGFGSLRIVDGRLVRQ